MPDGFDAGSIFVQLKADLSDFNAGLALAKAGLDDLASGGQEVEVAFQELDTSVVVFQEMEEAVTQASGSMATLGAALAQSTTATTGQTQATNQNEQAHSKAGITWARSATRILSVQLALLQLSQNASGPAKEAIQGLSNGVAVATASMRIFGDSLSFVGGGLIGIAVAGISAWARDLQDVTKATDASTDETAKTDKAIRALGQSITDANERAAAFKLTLSQQLTQALQASEAAFARNQKILEDLPASLEKVRSSITALTGAISDDEITHFADALTRQQIINRNGVILDVDKIQALIQQYQALQRLQINIANQQKSISLSAPIDAAHAEVVKLNEALQQTRNQLNATKDNGALAIKLGIEDPATAATNDLQAAKKVFDQILEDNAKIREIANSGKIPLDQQAAFLAQNLHSDTDIAAAASAVKSALQSKEAIDATNQLASTFSTSVGDGLRTALVDGQKPMQALATVGQNLFANMVDQTVKRLETGLTDAFKAITGVAGSSIGLALTGILGAAGALLSKLGNSQSNSYGNVQSAVTSSQAVRGIVAGPASVAIADVGSNLQTAMQPVVDALTAANGWLQKIYTNTKGGGGGGGSGSPQVAVATR